MIDYVHITELFIYFLFILHVTKDRFLKKVKISNANSELFTIIY